MSCGECENSRVEQMGRGREMLFCAKARRFVGASLPSGSGKAVLAYGTGPAWCERCGGGWGRTDCHGLLCKPRNDKTKNDRGAIGNEAAG